MAGEDSGAEDELSRSEEEGDSEVEDEEDEESSTHSEDDHAESEDDPSLAQHPASCSLAQGWTIPPDMRSIWYNTY